MTDTNFQSSQDPHIMQNTIIEAVENEYLPTATLKPIFFREKNIPILFELSKVCIEIGKLEEEEREVVENNESDESHENNEEKLQTILVAKFQKWEQELQPILIKLKESSSSKSTKNSKKIDIQEVKKEEIRRKSLIEEEERDKIKLACREKSEEKVEVEEDVSEEVPEWAEKLLAAMANRVRYHLEQHGVVIQEE